MCQNTLCKAYACAIDYGLCHCGCGEKVGIISRNHYNRGTIKGEPYLFVHNHHNNKSPVEYLVNKNTGCWEWQKNKDNKGYGRKYTNSRSILSHRYFYEQKYGLIPEGLDLDHLCRNSSCCNPDHLEPVTRAENIHRGNGAKLTWETVNKIRSLYTNEKISHRELAKMFNVGATTIGYVLSYKTWRKMGE